MTMKVFAMHMLISAVVVLALPMLTLSEAKPGNIQNNVAHNLALLRGAGAVDGHSLNTKGANAAFLELRSMLSVALASKARAQAAVSMHMRSPASDMLVAVDHILTELRSDQKADKAAHDKAWSTCKTGLGGVRKELFGESTGVNGVHMNLQAALRKKAVAVVKVLKTRDALDEARHLLQHTNKTLQVSLQAREFAVMQHETHLENEQRARLVVTKIQQYIQHSAPSTPDAPSNENNGGSSSGEGEGEGKKAADKDKHAEVVVSEGQAELEGALTALELVEEAHQHLRKRSRRSLSSSKDQDKGSKALQPDKAAGTLPVDDSSEAAIQANATLEANKQASHRTLGASLEMLKAHVAKSSETLAAEWNKATAAHEEVMMRLKHKMLDEKEAVYMATAALREAEEEEETAQQALLKYQREEADIKAMNKGLTSPNETEVALAYASHTCNNMHKSALNREHVRSVLIKLALTVRNEMENLLKSIMSKAETPVHELPKPVDAEKVDLAVTEAANEAAVQKEKEAAEMAISGTTGMTGGDDDDESDEKAPAATGLVDDTRNNGNATNTKNSTKAAEREDRLSEALPSNGVEDSAEDIERNTANDDYLDDPSGDPAEAQAKDGKAKEVMQKLATEQLEKDSQSGFDEPSHSEDEKKNLVVGDEQDKDNK